MWLRSVTIELPAAASLSVDKQFPKSVRGAYANSVRRQEVDPWRLLFVLDPSYHFCNELSRAVVGGISIFSFGKGASREGRENEQGRERVERTEGVEDK